jgi:hypothetical protein
MRKTNPPGQPRQRQFFFVILLAIVLGLLFAKSFMVEYVHFANDGPVGVQMRASESLPAGFTGSWGDLNDIGSSGGAYPPSPSILIRWLLGPVGYAKFYAPVALFILGLGAWTFFRQLKFSPLAAALGALAAALNGLFLAAACWGVASQEIAIGMDFFALALVVSNTAATSALIRWVRLALAGLCVGVNVMEAADIGAIFSIFIAAYVFFKALVDEGGSVPAKCTRGVGRVAVIAVFAGFIAMQTVLSLVGSQIQGVVGTGQDSETKAAHWDWATQWSRPKKETLGLFVPGLFGYKMDTPKDMMQLFQDAYKGGNNWGGVGRTPEIDRFFDSGATGSPPSGPGDIMRFTDGGNYCGILVMLVAFWAIAQSLRRRDSVFTENQRRYIWFWSVVLVATLLLAWGRFAPFYALLYKLPYFSTIRNPNKFLYVFSWALVILFGYGVQALSRRYLEVPAGKSISVSAQLKNWWAKAGGFDRKWTFTCAAAVAASALAWLIYAGEKPSLIKYLQTVGPFPAPVEDIAAFSINQVGWFVLLFTLAAGLCVMVISGIFSGKRAKLGGLLIGLLLVIDLGRAALPYVIHWDYIQKYDVDPANHANSINPIINFLRDKPYENRVVRLPRWFPYLPQIPQTILEQEQEFDQLYDYEWSQHHFQYYNIQSLDVVQMSREPVDLAAFDGALQPRFMQDNTGHLMLASDTIHLVDRRWQLTNTRYLLGAAGWLDVLNSGFDPVQRRFRILKRFDIVLKPGVQEFHQRLEELTATLNDNGPYALFEFTGALPRAKLYSNWQVNTNDTANLQTLADVNFDPAKTVLVSTPQKNLPDVATNENSGTVEFKSYTPKHIVFTANAATPSVLLLNDRYDAGWRVTVDGQPAQMLRCNFIMRGVYLASGNHTVEFNFTLPNKPLYVTLAAIATGIFLLGLLIFLKRCNPSAEI